MPCNQNNTESFYANAANYCRDTPFSGLLHPGKTCYREVPVRLSDTDTPPGDQVCFDACGNCEDSYDRVSPVACRNTDGSCVLSAAGAWGHFVSDMLPTFRDFLVVAAARPF